jgi:hypothetical protein
LAAPSVDKPLGIGRIVPWLGLMGAVAVVAVALYVFGVDHKPDPELSLFGKTGEDTLPLKSWLATGVLALAATQLSLALWMYGRLPVRVPGVRVVNTHRLVGAGAILLSLPIAYHCVLAYGVQTHFDTRVAVHSLVGCFFYGAVAAKLLIVRSRRFPGWTLPLAGGTLVVAVAILWYTSALWYFDDFSLPSL